MVRVTGGLGGRIRKEEKGMGMRSEGAPRDEARVVRWPFISGKGGVAVSWDWTPGLERETSKISTKSQCMTRTARRPGQSANRLRKHAWKTLQARDEKRDMIEGNTMHHTRQVHRYCKTNSKKKKQENESLTGLVSWLCGTQVSNLPIVTLITGAPIG